MMYLVCRACKWAAFLVVLALMFSTGGVRAASFFYQFTNVFAGTTPDGSPAWVSSMFSDVTPGTVQLKISASGLADGEYLSAMFFNLDPGLNPAKLTFSYVGSSGGFALPTIKKGANDFKADGQGKYDIDLKFSQKAGKEFSGNDYLIFDVTSSAFTLTASDFDVLCSATGGGSEFLAAAEISGIPGVCNTTGTGWIAPGLLTPAPEPRALALLALGGGFGIAGACRRRIRARRV
jgi:hypothetical protein